MNPFFFSPDRRVLGLYLCSMLLLTFSVPSLAQGAGGGGGSGDDDFDIDPEVLFELLQLIVELAIHYPTLMVSVLGFFTFICVMWLVIEAFSSLWRWLCDVFRPVTRWFIRGQQIARDCKYPSGVWRGHYHQYGKRQSLLDFELEFLCSGAIVGSGTDEIGAYKISGQWTQDQMTLEK